MMKHLSKDEIFELNVDLLAKTFQKGTLEQKLRTGNARFGITPATMDYIVFWCQN